jgi:PTH1 family peptidyl-tRNA hydrolase
MILFAGLGNPGAKYAGNRHNIGFMAVDAIIRRHGFSAARKRFQGDICEGVLDGERVLVLKPQTFMNESGRSVGETVAFYKLEPAQVVVFHDELDLEPGKVRVKTGGGLAGHNGLRSVAERFGSREFRRVRFGIGHPGHKELVTGHVLGDFAAADRDWVEPLLAAFAEAAPLLAAGDDAGCMNRIALLLQPPRPPREQPEER